MSLVNDLASPVTDLASPFTDEPDDMSMLIVSMSRIPSFSFSSVFSKTSESVLQEASTVLGGDSETLFDFLSPSISFRSISQYSYRLGEIASGDPFDPNDELRARGEVLDFITSKRLSK